MGIFAIFGGTFNPFHVGHRQILDNLSNIDEIEKIFLIPTKIPPHKTVSFLANEQDRINMCKIIASKYDKVEISSIELQRVGKSYTIDTLKSFKDMYPEKDIAITIGADMVVTFNEWKEYITIIQNAKLITFSRVGTNDTHYKQGLKALVDLGADIIEIENKIINVSSTQIRDMLKQGIIDTELLDSEVRNYIIDNNVYGVKNGFQ